MKERRQTILATAYGMMGTKGLEAVHARTVAAEIGINHATVHYYFPKRSDLLMGIADYAMSILQDDRARFHEGASTVADRFQGDVLLAEAYSRKGSRFFRVLCGLFVASAQDPALKKKVKALWAAWSEPIAKVAGDVAPATLFGLGFACQTAETAAPSKFESARNTFSPSG
ncbi:MAG: TetR/AcrR family transcriptional regulator [Fimbriimonadaceae bacterium]|nr:TetR/AcrR family transcriptional regulator [Fimbriimonadaceae bacterium]QYK57629.1 MAG: TetR/AcrR family transcriptional regulator [Fimbriimonadaceae bacterium]